MINWENVEFKNEKRFLSNMYPCKIVFEEIHKIKGMFPDVPFDGLSYGSSEHIYMAMKSENPLWHKIIQAMEEPRETKKAARKQLQTGLLFETEDVFSFRSDWDDVKYEIMRAIVYLKFIQNKHLADQLITLDGYIEERNDWNDTYWGTCEDIGENNLGKILMEVRDYLLNKKV